MPAKGGGVIIKTLQRVHDFIKTDRCLRARQTRSLAWSCSIAENRGQPEIAPPTPCLVARHEVCASGRTLTAGAGSGPLLAHGTIGLRTKHCTLQIMYALKVEAVFCKLSAKRGRAT